MKWEKVIIGSCLEKVANINPTMAYGQNEFFYLDISSVCSTDKIITSHQTIKGTDAPSRARQLIKSGDILVSTVRPNLNAVALVPPTYDNTVASTGFCILRPTASKLSTRYLYYWVRSSFFIDDMVKKATGASYPAVSDKIIKDSEIPLPPLHIQEQIADTLDKSDALRKKDQELLQKYDQLAQAIFYEMFGDPVRNERGWKYLTLEQISLVKGQYGSGASAIEYDPKKYRYVRITDISENGRLNNKPVSASENNSDYELQNGDLLFARTGATVGKTYLYKDEDGPCIYAGYLIRFRINREFAVPEYVFHFCKTKYYKNWVAAKQNVVAQPNINAQQYGKELLIPIPPINLQEKFLKLLTKNEKSSDLCSSGFNKTECLFSTLLQTNFS